LAWLPFALIVAVTAAIVAGTVSRIGVKPLMLIGLALVTGCMLLMTRVSATGSYLTEMLPAFVLGAIGLGCAMVSAQVAVFTGVDEHETGLASGIVNTTQEIGGALGVAVLASAALTITTDRLRSADGSSVAVAAALTDGFQVAYTVGAALAAVGFLLALVLIQTPRASIATSDITEKRAA
jgi:MFS family permease